MGAELEKIVALAQRAAASSCTWTGRACSCTGGVYRRIRGRDGPPLRYGLRLAVQVFQCRVRSDPRRPASRCWTACTTRAACSAAASPACGRSRQSLSALARRDSAIVSKTAVQVSEELVGGSFRSAGRLAVERVPSGTNLFRLRVPVCLSGRLSETTGDRAHHAGTASGRRVHDWCQRDPEPDPRVGPRRCAGPRAARLDARRPSPARPTPARSAAP